jgi:hypothetical protein
MPLPNPNITPGAPPLRWDRVLEAFTQVNENFDSIAATISGGGGGLSPINFDTLDTNVSPAADNTYTLGALGTNRWKSVFLAEYQDTPADAANGVYIGSAHIKGIGSHIDLPINSTINGELIQQPYFNAIQVDNELRLEATATSTPFGETVNLNSGTKIQLVVNSAGDSITFNNTGVTELAGTAGQIGISGTTGNITLTNLGVLSLTNVTALPAGRTEGAGININASTGSGIKVTNTGVLSIVAGSAALIVNTDVATGVVTITNSAPAGNTFGSIIVAGDTSFPIVANSPGANFKVNSGEGIILTKDTITDTLTITVDPVFDLKGSVFADDSSILVDAVSGIIPAAVVVGTFTGSVIGNVTGNITGNVTGNTTGTHDGDVSGSVFADDSTLLVDGVDGKIVGPINSFDGGNSITMDPVNGVIIGGTAGAQIIGAAGAPVYIGGGTSGGTSGDIFLGNGTNRVLFVSNVIDTDDSSALIFEPPVTFNTDVTFENDITVAERLTVKGSRVINLTELQAITATSADFADFQTRIAALV